MRILLVSIFLLFFTVGFTQVGENEEKKIIHRIATTNNYTPQKEQKSELRGVWIASIDYIDWPSRQGLNVEEQKKEFINILNNVQKWNMNAVFVQIKPVGDAFYPSQLSPWSVYLTGIQGRNPGYDPLKFMINETHKRGIEFHAWFNPYRVSLSLNKSKLSSNNIVFKNAEWIVPYGNKLYLNPGIPEVSDYVIASVMEVVRNYNIDGVHFDDYFYPYKIKGQEYNDYTQYKKYNKNFTNREDWRRNNINQLIYKLGKAIKEEKPEIRFGISPFGVWRNIDTDPERGSNTKAGIQNYDDLYADIILWMEKKWIDYVVPQIYWHRGFSLADYTTLLEWWVDASKETDIDLYIGQAAYKIKDWKDEEELIDQIYLNRKHPEVKGSIFFSYTSLVRNPKNVLNQLISGPYSKKYNEIN